MHPPKPRRRMRRNSDKSKTVCANWRPACLSSHWSVRKTRRTGGKKPSKWCSAGLLTSAEKKPTHPHFFRILPHSPYHLTRTTPLLQFPPVALPTQGLAEQEAAAFHLRLKHRRSRTSLCLGFLSLFPAACATGGTRRQTRQQTSAPRSRPPCTTGRTWHPSPLPYSHRPPIHRPRQPTPT